MAFLDDNQLRGISPFLVTPVGRILGKVAMRLLNLHKFKACYDKADSLSNNGPDFAMNVVRAQGADYHIAGLERLKELISSGPFITISNHPYGGFDGVVLIDLIGHLHPDYKVIVNKILAMLEALQENFITVTPTTNERVAPTRDSIYGIRLALKHIKDGHPLGIFPSGAVSDLDRKSGKIEDREWQLPIIRLIQKAAVPIVPIRFFDGNTKFFYKLGLIDWKVRLMRLPTEVINKAGRQVRLAIGEVISPATQKLYPDIEDFRSFLRESVYGMEMPQEFEKRSLLEL